MTEAEHLAAIDGAVKAAERKLALVDGPDPDGDPDAYFDAWESIYHCETCLVRETLDVVWPAVQNYIDWLKSV
jgi:hypothetical protein